MKIIGICGSLRKASFNAQLLRAAQNCLPGSIIFETVSVESLPHYNQDLDGESKPEAVATFLNTINQASAILIVTPEYNYSIPGLLKNALDWASRPAFQSPLLNKPCGILSASIGLVGGARAQVDLKKVLLCTHSKIYPANEYMLPLAHEKFDAGGNLTDPTAQARLEKYILGFVEWIALN